MRIVQCVTLASTDGAFGGPLAVAIEQSRELARLGHDVTLLAAWDGEIELRVPGVRVVLARGTRVPGTGFSGVHAASLVRWLRQNRTTIDVVHVHFGRHLLDLCVAETARRLGITYVLQTHGMVMPDHRLPIRVLDALRTRRLLREALAVLTLSDRETQGVDAIAPGAAVRTIRNGTRPVERPTRGPSATPEVLFLSRLHPRKRVLAFTEAARIVASSNAEVRFSVVGPDEGDLPELQEFIDQHPEVPLTYEGSSPPGTGATRIAEADVYVLPSFGEVFPMALLEALAAGTPVVTTSDCAIAPALEQAGAALVTDGTPDAIASAVQQLLQDQALRDRQRDAGIRLILGELGAGAVARELEAIYQCTPPDQPKIIWITNQAAPYRLPLWAALADDARLEVWLLESDDNVLNDSNNRGDDWAIGNRNFPFTVRTIPTVVVKRGEARHYLSGWPPLRRRDRIDAVLLGGWDSPAYWLAALAARSIGARRIGFYESHALSRHHRGGIVARARRFFFRSLDGVVVPGPASRDTLVGDGIPLDRLHVGFNAVDVGGIHEQAALRREALGETPPRSGLRIVVVGQLIERKNVGAVLDALAAPGLELATLSVVGTGPLLPVLTSQARMLGVADRTTFLGHVPSDTIAEMFAAHDVLVLASLEEVWGLVVNEALAAGLRVVVSDRAGVAPSVANMEGVTIAAPTSAAIADALRLLVDVTPITDPEILRWDPKRFAQVFLEALRPVGDLT